ncbi:pyridoxal phosphate-dependent aminotransferase [Aquibium sp. ELW1220]|uniref:pyridoxal phosphate-dependent aminotransferase n=1 Tax=Aquibium sp. ELW1220 TaxID=2976766 RepID=UPI0025B08926|nr:pyridoxal phosphate-dependent aminotransferase [Aquibium sp. ELW1220]MDN2583955.1 pyridoxal phosphate-dependent aminotransferase [Aquibium sp. ELW1220]
MQRLPRLTPLAAALPSTVPFVGPEAQERSRGAPFRARIGANESGFGPAPSVVAAMSEAAGAMWKYCDPDNFDLKASLARHLGIGAQNVVIGEGIDGLLGLAVRLYAGPGDTVVTSLGAYPTFNFHVAGFGARLVAVPYRDDKEDLQGLADAVKRDAAQVVYLSNPDNPMGTWWEASDVEAFVDAIPPTTLILLDEAYGETGPAAAQPRIDLSRKNLVRLRTFSKAYGLAGLRCGYAFGDAEVIRGFEKVRNHYGINKMAQVAGEAALADQAYLAEVVARVAAGRDRIAGIARDNGLSPIRSATNFVTIDCGGDGAFALKVLQEMLARDVFIRKPMAPGLDRCIRISVGLDAELDLFAEELPKALAAARAG